MTTGTPPPSPSLTIHTQRLRLAPFEAGEAPGLHALWTRPEVRRYLWDDEIIPGAQTEAIVATSRELFATRGFGLWSVREIASPTLLGFAGFWHFRHPPELEILLGFDPAHWGRGFAHESGRALVDYAFSSLGFAEVRGSCDEPNQRSRRMMERMGMELERRQVVGGLDTVFFRIPPTAPEV